MRSEHTQGKCMTGEAHHSRQRSHRSMYIVLKTEINEKQSQAKKDHENESDNTGK